MPRCPRCAFAALALLAVAFLGGCDTNNPSSPLEEVQGVYRFTELRFVPQAQAIAEADVHARLDSANTSVEVFGDGPTLIRYQFEGGSTVRADAIATATSATVRLTAESEEDAARLARLLVPPTLSLSRSPDDRRLTAQFTTTVNLQAFDAALYQGLTAQPGTLYVTLERN